MKDPSFRLGATLAPLALLWSCSSTQVEPIGPEGPPLENYSADAIRSQAVKCLEAREVSAREQVELLEKLDAALKKHADWLQEPGITFVAAFHSAAGGFIYKGGGGDGYVSFAGGDEAVPFEVSGYEVGATIGGGAHWGIALGLGLRDQRRFAGHYSTKGVGATGGATEAGFATATYVGENGHQVRYFSTGYGVEADATVGRFTVTFKE
jgi:hypothetical protein